MHAGDFYRVVTKNFISAAIIAFMVCLILSTFNLNAVLHIGNLFGLYFLTVYGVEMLIGAGELENDHRRFGFVIACIIIFNILFLVLAPIFFGPTVLASADYLVFIFNGAKISLNLNVLVYLAIYAILMLIFNYWLYKHRDV